MKNFQNVFTESISRDKIGTIFIIAKLFRLAEENLTESRKKIGRDWGFIKLSQ